MKLFAAVGAGVLAGSLWSPWHTLVLDGAPDLALETAWQHSAVLAAILTALAALALRLRAAAAIAAVVVAATLVFAPDNDAHRDAGPSLALLGALTAALPEPRQVTRLGAVAVLGALFGPWHDRPFFILTRGSGDSTRLDLLGPDATAWQVSVPIAIALVLLAGLAIARPALARATAWAAIALVVYLVITPHPDTAYGAWLALAGSILAWAGGLEAHRPPNITEQCSPATRSSTSPASPASS